jgi:ceramide glucosyltransferase
LLKPLCGIDDGLFANLQTFARLEYPCFEVLLGVQSRSDPAYALARRAAARWPDRMQVVLQRGAPGLNPKVNQLITLAERARYDLLVISDSNVAVDPDYLDEIAAYLEDEDVGLVTHPIAGAGEETWGALFDNIHLCAFVGPGMIAANRCGGSLAVGKSMAFRRAELRAIGGFEALQDVLAEDFVMGRAIARVCSKRVVVARRPVVNVCCRRTVGGFVERYSRWNVMQRSMVGRTVYCAQLLLHPLPFGLVALAVEPTRQAAAAALLIAVTKAALECLAIRALRPGATLRLQLLALPFKDLLLLCAWVAGLFRNEVQWRGKRLLVLEGTRLAPSAAQGRWAVHASPR